MTTLVQTRNPLETLSMNSQPQRRRSKRLAAYDQEDGDFKYTRSSKRTRTEPTPSMPSRTKQSKPHNNESKTQAKRHAGLDMALSTPARDDSNRPSKYRTRRSLRSSIDQARNGREDGGSAGHDDTELDAMDIIGASKTEEQNRADIEGSKESMKIALPFSDTPIINRNKELRRKGTSGRRSSLGLRGRRASSLIDMGHSAIPHQQVETSQFYKHIEAEGLSEPRRMKQLLVWCGERMLGSKRSYNIQDNAAILAARAIQEGILKDFSNRSEMSDWFNREDTLRPAAPKLPNPINTRDMAKIEELEESIKRLEIQRDELKAMMKPPPALPPLFDSSRQPPSPSTLDPSLLDPEGAAILASLADSKTHSAQIEKRLKTIQTNIEFQVDQFADGVHKLEQTRLTVEGVANRVLCLSAMRLEERDKHEKEKVGTRDLPIQEVLRTLSRIMPEEGAGGTLT